MIKWFLSLFKSKNDLEIEKLQLEQWLVNDEVHHCGWQYKYLGKDSDFCYFDHLGIYKKFPIIRVLKEMNNITLSNKFISEDLSKSK